MTQALHNKIETGCKIFIKIPFVAWRKVQESKINFSPLALHKISIKIPLCKIEILLRSTNSYHFSWTTYSSRSLTLRRYSVRSNEAINKHLLDNYPCLPGRLQCSDKNWI